MRDKTYFYGEQYSWVPLFRGLNHYNITYHTAMSVAERKSDFNLLTDTPYFAHFLIHNLEFKTAIYTDDESFNIYKPYNQQVYL